MLVKLNILAGSVTDALHVVYIVLSGLNVAMSQCLRDGWCVGSCFRHFRGEGVTDSVGA